MRTSLYRRLKQPTFVGQRPIDNFSGAALAYGTRNLRAAYTGPALRVRRSSDNTEQDVGFKADGTLDEVSLLAFVGAGNGFVTTLYDQSGNSRNAVQTTAANQPQIVASGVVSKENNRPVVTFSSASSQNFSLISAVSALRNVTGAHALFAIKWASATEDAVIASVLHFATGAAAASANPRFQFGRAAAATQARVLTRRLDADASVSRIGDAVADTLMQSWSVESDFAGAGTVGLRRNNARNFLSNPLASTGNSEDTASTFAFLGSACTNAGTPNQFWDGSLAEFILYANNTDIANRRFAVQANQIAYYGIS